MRSSIPQLQTRVAQIVAEHIAPMAEQVDEQCLWPEHTLRAMAQAGLLGLHVPERLGGSGQGLLALAVLTETIAKACSSSALCYGMHCVGTAVIAAKATPYHEERYLRPIARGEHITTLALSEGGTGSNFYLPQSQLREEGGDYVVTGEKQFVTNGGHAHSYVISTAAQSRDDVGDFSCLIVDENTAGVAWVGQWEGLGMRGNSSRSMRLDDIRLSRRQLLGDEGDQVWYVFEVVAPYFLMAMAGTYLGIAASALDEVAKHLTGRRHSHSGELLSELPLVQHRFAELWTAVSKTRSLVYEAAQLGDAGDPTCLPFLLASKADAAETAVHVTNEAMTLAGGIAYRANSRLARLLRDARAGHVMGPTTDVLKTWLGRAALGLPLL